MGVVFCSCREHVCHPHTADMQAIAKQINRVARSDPWPGMAHQPNAWPWTDISCKPTNHKFFSTLATESTPHDTDLCMSCRLRGDCSLLLSPMLLTWRRRCRSLSTEGSCVATVKLCVRLQALVPEDTVGLQALGTACLHVRAGSLHGQVGQSRKPAALAAGQELPWL